MNEQSEERQLSLAEALGLAMRLHQSGQIPQAEAAYEAILVAVPALPDALHFLGVLRFQQHRAEEGLALIRRALEIAPDYADAHNNLGNILKERGDRAGARAAYQRVIELNPDHAGAHNNLGVLYRLADELEAAVVAYRRAAELAPGFPDTYFNLGNVLSEMRRFDEAVAAYREALRLNPRHLWSHKQLGMTLYRLGRNAEAVEIYRSWLELSPNHPVALHMLAACSGENVPDRAGDSYVRDLFDQFAANFDEHLGHLGYQAPALVAQAVRDSLGEPGGDLVVLDAGCGTGLCGPLVKPYARHLTGVDLSAGMLARAREKGCYDELVEAELTSYLAGLDGAADLIVSADTLVYFGDLSAVLGAAAGALRPGGRLVFSVERDERDEGFRLDFSGRYCHGEGYLRRVLEEAGLRVSAMVPVELRMEGGHPVAGYIVSACVTG